jgi:hypothetical protein
MAKKKILGIPATRYQKQYQENSLLPKAKDTDENGFLTMKMPKYPSDGYLKPLK